MMRLATWAVLAAAFASGCKHEPTRAGMQMHGYALADFGNFTRDWRLVTTRYRQDTNEQRFTYANDKAMATITLGKTDYPDGAMFAKIGFITEVDPAFPSSLVPSGARRYQFMVRDAKRFQSTQGWGYVIFNGLGVPLPGDPVEASQACAGCHLAVERRGYVFSQPMHLSPEADRHRDDKGPERVALDFAEVGVEQLPPRLARLLPKETRAVRTLQGPIRAHVFGGTLDELRPLLLEQALATTLPAAIIADDPVQFAVAFRDPSEKEPCANGGVRAHYALSGPSPKVLAPRPEQNESFLREGSECVVRR